MRYSAFDLLVAIAILVSACSTPKPVPTAAIIPASPTPLITGVTPLPPTPTLAPPLPTATFAPLPLPTLPPTPAPAAILGYHIVRSGETLYCIGRAYRIQPAAIAQQNGLSNVSALSVGQKLAIPNVLWDSVPPGPVCARQF